MKRIYSYIIFALCLASCAKNMDADQEKKMVPFEFGRDMQTNIVPFVSEGEDPSATKVNVDGDQFVSRDLIRLRLICPFVSTAEAGENPWSTTDGWFLLYWNGANNNWLNVNTSFNFDVNGDYRISGSPSLHVLVQSTTYVFTATTWSEEIHFVAPSSKSHVTTFSNIFKADQRRSEDFRSSDVLWAQQIMQTGTPNARLSFNHKMAAVRVKISDELASQLDNDYSVVLTLENMPDMDHREVVIGNYYLNKSKLKNNYGDWTRSICSYEENGKVLGIVYPGSEKFERLAIEDLDQNGVYTAYKRTEDALANTYDIIIPPYTVPEDATPTLWLRNGSKRWSAQLTLPDDRTFKSGVMYEILMNKPSDIPADKEQ